MVLSSIQIWTHFWQKFWKTWKFWQNVVKKGVIQWEIVENRSWIIKTGVIGWKLVKKWARASWKKGFNVATHPCHQILAIAPSHLQLGYSISLSLCNPPSYPIWTSMGDKSSRATGGVGISNGSAKLIFYLKSTYPLCSSLVKSTTAEHYAKSVWISYGSCPMG